MGQYKNFLLRIQEECAPENGFAQDAIEWAVLSGHVLLTGDPDIDCRAVMGEGGANYDKIIEGYRRWQRDLKYASLAPLFEAITQPFITPLPTRHENITTDISSPSGQRRPAPKIPAETRGVGAGSQIQRLAGMGSRPDAPDVQPEERAVEHQP